MVTLALSKRSYFNAGFLTVLLLISIGYGLFGPLPEVKTRTVAVQPIDSDDQIQPEIEDAIETVRQEIEAEKAAPAIAQPSINDFVVHIVKKGETLSTIWRAHGAPSTGGAKAAQAWEALGISLKSLRPGVELKLTVRGGDIVEVSRKLPNGDQIVISGNSREGYIPSVKKISVVETERTVSGTILTSFASSAAANGVPYEIVDELVDLFSTRLEFRKDLHPGDSFTVTYKERRCGDSAALLDAGDISAASINSGGSMIAAIRHIGPSGQSRYYNEEGNPIGNYFLRYPVKFTRISSVFSTARFHPILQRARAHNGVDFAAPIGTPVRSVADGVVSFAGYKGGAGNVVQISHGSRFTTAYLHLSKISKGLRAGYKVARGEVIGAVGMTGLATGPHLHFSLFDNGKYINPLTASLPNLLDKEERIPTPYLLAALTALKNARVQTMQVASTGSSTRNA
jgi:murein DD-endopeptidase MepM/ murein hydrolase activator NlpD